MAAHKRKLSKTEQEQLRREYEAHNPYNPDSETVEELAARWGISRPTLYRWRQKWIDEDERRAVHLFHESSTSAELVSTVSLLTRQVVELQKELAWYRQTYGARENDESPNHRQGG